MESEYPGGRDAPVHQWPGTVPRTAGIVVSSAWECEMLPHSILERMASSYGLKMGERNAERRTSVRVPLRLTGKAYPVSHRMLLEGIRIVVRDLSCNGLGILVANRDNLGPQWVVCLGNEPETTEMSLVLLCRTTRIRPAGPTQMLVGGSIDAMLEPGQRVAHGRVVQGFRWIGTTTETPKDPFLRKAG